MTDPYEDEYDVDDFEGDEFDSYDGESLDEEPFLDDIEDIEDDYL
jgi:hypothetical protein